jgi:hypothetical protein
MNIKKPKSIKEEELKRKKIDDDELDDEIEDNYEDSESNDDDKDDNINDDIYMDIIDGDDEDDDELPDDEDDDNDDGSENGDTVYFKFNTTNHKMEGKHRLKRDTIFHGKLEEEKEDYLYSSNSDYYNKDFPIEKGTIFEMESRNHEELQNQRELKNDIYKLLRENTELDFTSNRRKPNKQAFNSYYEMLLLELKNKYTKSEIFVELSYYFTDHIFNMYKLLYPQHATSIIMELRDKGYLNELDDMIFV